MTAEIDLEDISCDTIIYKSLLNLDMKMLYEQYDGFILDEYHRAGATQTYEKIKELKELIKNGKEDKKIIQKTDNRTFFDFSLRLHA